VMTKFFNWCASRDVIQTSPCVGVATPAKETARDRVLNDDELRRLWLAGEAVGGNISAYVKLLILTAQRRSTIAELRHTEVDGDVLVLPAIRMKGKQAHVLPLSVQAAAIIAAMPKVDDFVLGLRWRFSDIKRALDTHMGDVPKWVIHDVR